MEHAPLQDGRMWRRWGRALLAVRFA